jgi:cytochrome c-type biogenesis protein CcmH/NrfG
VPGKRPVRLVASAPVSTLAAAPARAGDRVPASSAPADPPSPRTNLILGTGLAIALVALAFLTRGSTDQTVTAAGTWCEIAVTLAGAGACAAMVFFGRRARAWGAGSVLLFAAFTAFAGLSIVWSVQPDWSWFGANQLLAYLAVFAGAAAVARTFPERWPALLGGIAAATVAVGAYSLLAKVFPASLASTNTYGRLQAPFGYWNAVGAAAALGLPACLWAAARRNGGWLLRGIAVPAMTILISVIILSLSRSALLAAVLGVGGFIALVPLRLRSALMLGLAAAGAAATSGWALSHSALTTDNIALPAQDSAGHSFGVVLLIVVLVMIFVGLAAAWASDQVTVRPLVRRRIGSVLLVGVALIPVAGVAALAASSRGLTGEISHAWHQLTSSTGTTDASTRVTQLGSSRPLYWHQGLQVGEHALLKGVGELGYGIARLQYTTNAAKSDQAHSYLVQTFADLGLIGLAVTLALLGAWAWAAARPLAPRTPWRRLDAAQAGERQGMVALAAVVLAFGVSSALDWTWYFPGVVIPALLAAGWLAGRGPLLQPVGRRLDRRPALERPGALAVAVLLAAVAVIGGWLMWQPLRSAQDATAAELTSSNAIAFADARAAARADPLSVEPLFQLATLYAGIGDNPSARSELEQATRLQPHNPDPWLWLAQFETRTGHPRAAAAAAGRVLALDHTSDPDTRAAQATIGQAQAMLAQRAARARSRRRHRGHPPAARTST